MESRKLSILKAVSYRIICITTMLTVMYLFTDNVGQSVYVTIIFQTLQTILYYFHERIWAKILSAEIV
jgi:uncharacterized membrane protein